MTLKNEHRDLALANMHECAVEDMHPSLAEAVYWGCKWWGTKEGEDFWGDIYESIEEETYFDAPQLTPETCEAKAKERMATQADYDKLDELTAALPTDSDERKTYPIYGGLFCYFPDALAEVSNLSYQGNQQHHPDKPLHWDDSKSTDSRDALLRHIIDMEKANKALDFEKELDEAKRVAWRGLENLQRLITGKCQYTNNK